MPSWPATRLTRVPEQDDRIGKEAQRVLSEYELGNFEAKMDTTHSRKQRATSSEETIDEQLQGIVAGLSTAAPRTARSRSSPPRNAWSDSHAYRQTHSVWSDPCPPSSRRHCNAFQGLDEQSRACLGKINGRP